VTAPSPPPGWYADPDGGPGTARWWDGRAWSDVTTPAGPGVDVRTMPGDVPRWESDEELISSGPDPSPRGRTRLLLVLGAVALAVVVAVAALVGTRGDVEPSSAAAPTSTVALPSPSRFPPGTVRIVDENAGISYPHLGDGWYEYDLLPKAETVGVAGQYFVTQEDPPSGGVYLAECTSGPLADGFGWTGPDSLRDTALRVAASERAGYYPAPNQQRVLRDEARTVDGHRAHLVEFQLSWDVPGYDATGERVAVLLVDVGRPVPALLFVSIPDTHAELYGVIDRVVRDVDVLG
jgi:hypothetical protein